jgi:hypothetical protein
MPLHELPSIGQYQHRDTINQLYCTYVPLRLAYTKGKQIGLLCIPRKGIQGMSPFDAREIMFRHVVSLRNCHLNHFSYGLRPGLVRLGYSLVREHRLG